AYPILMRIRGWHAQTFSTPATMRCASCDTNSQTRLADTSTSTLLTFVSRSCCTAILIVEELAPRRVRGRAQSEGSAIRFDHSMVCVALGSGDGSCRAR